MKRMRLEQARRLAAQPEAYDLYCRFRGVPEPAEDRDDEVLAEHARA
jgi:hypothetical protein